MCVPLDDEPQLARVKAANNHKAGIRGVLKPKDSKPVRVNFLGCENRDYNKRKIGFG